MAKYENPRITVERFEIENIITASGTGTDPTPQPNAVNVAVDNFKGNGVNNVMTFKFTL